MRAPLRIAIVGTNDPRNYSGGRYHGLIMAYAVAAGAGECHVVTDHVPSFVADLEPLAPGRVIVHRTPDFVAGLPEGRFDWVVVVPTGIFHPEFYENCLDFAARAQARLALVNFESANWFNLLAPERRDPRLWDYWRRVVSGGGLVVSSTRESDRYARQFYACEPGARLRFEVWSPPINSPAARRFDGMPKDGSILAFVRPQDKHKGSTDIVEIDPALLRGRTLRLVAGRDISPEFRAGIEAHMKKAPGSRVEFSTRIPDLQKFRLLTAAQAVLFPTRFEGYGYPPVEAAFVGTESVCFDLPVLRETVGAIAHFAPLNDMAAFSEALAKALGEPERRSALRSSVHRIADFAFSAELLADIFLRSNEAVLPCAPRHHRASIGPFQRDAPRPAAEIAADAPVPPLPDALWSAGVSSAGDAVFSVTFFVAGIPDRVEARNPGGADFVATWTVAPAARGFHRIDIHLVAPGGILGRLVSVTAFAGPDQIGNPFQFQVDRLDARPNDGPVRFGISSDKVEGQSRTVRGWILARRPVTEVRVGDGQQWWSAPVSTDRPDILAKNPSYPTARCQFILDLPAGVKLDKTARLIALSGPVIVEALTGWPPAPNSLFPAEVALAELRTRLAATQATPAPPVAPAPAAHSRAEALPSWPQNGKRPAKRRSARREPPPDHTLTILDSNDNHWVNGIGRSGAGDRLGTVLVRLRKDEQAPAPGAIVRGASGRAQTISAVSRQDDSAVLSLDGPLNPYLDGFPNPLQLFAPPAGTTPSPPSFVLAEWTDSRWWRSVWNNRDERWRTGFFMRAELARILGVDVGARLEFCKSGLRRVVASVPQGKDVRIWLDGRIRPIPDGAPNPVRVLAAATQPTGDRLAIVAGPDGDAWHTGILGADRGALRWGTRVRVAPGSSVSRGDPLRFQSGRIARATSVEAVPGALEIGLDSVVDGMEDGFPGSVQPLTEAEAARHARKPWLYPDAGYTVKDPLHSLLARQARKDGRVVLAPPGRIRPERPRVLFLTLVPPAPANQGNRAVTRNFIQHLVGLGFDVDVVLQGWIDAFEATQVFGDSVRILSLPFPNWADCESVRQRKRVKDIAQAMRPSGLDAGTADSLARDSDLFHPYFTIRDEVVEAARTLATTHRYESIVVNYTHMLRVTKEIGRFVELPPVCVITHDALSRLPSAFEGQPIDTMYRACTPDTERAVLDSVPAVVLAISESEATYFKSIGVENPVLLTEYDALDETRPYTVGESGFDAKTFVLHGSANPMNIAGLNWFVDECWADILGAVKNAKLLICGRIGEKWKPPLPNIEVTGEISREAMFELCRRASVAINPCVAGTGLKIKTVEAACMGLPAVCLPLAVEGLEEVAPRFAIVAETGEAFAAACIALLTDEKRWRGLRASALLLAEERFSKTAVYHRIDDAMGWSKGVDERLATQTGEFSYVHGLADGPEPSLSAVSDPIVGLERSPDDPAALLTLGLQLARAGQVDAGRGLVERVVAERPGDPKTSALAAKLALDTGEPWLAAVHGSVVIGQRPLETEGYYLVGRGLLGAGLPAAAVECLTQGLLIERNHEGLLAELESALVAANRTEEAERWRSRRAAVCPIGEYFGLDVFRLGPHALRGWKANPDGSLQLSHKRAAIRFVLPESDWRELNFTLDLAVGRNGGSAGDYPVDLLANDRPFRVSLNDDAPVQTIRGSIPAPSFGANRVLTFTLDFGAGHSALPQVTPIGIMLTEA